MNLKSCPPHPLGEKKRSVFHSTRLIMRLIMLLTILSCFKVTAAVYAQQISLNVKDAPIEKVLDEIKKQSGYSLITKDDLLENASKVTITIKNASVRQALDECFKNQPFTYELVGKTIVVKSKPLNEENKPKRSPPLSSSLHVIGKVIDENGKPLPGATVKVTSTSLVAATDNNGAFTIDNVPEKSILMISFIGYETKEIPATENMLVILVPGTSILDAIQVIGYGTTTQRLSTGNVSSVSAQVLENQPVTNPLEALEGRVAGLQITQNSGLPGDAVTVQIRGRNSIAASNDPLYIVDGVPFTSSQVEILNGGNPMNSINPADIESIDVLKDADATSIYGSRAANGVILITTKKGKAGETKFNVNASTGISNVSRQATLLNTAQYLQVRRDGDANSAVTPTAVNDPDLLQWSPNADFNWQKWFMGNTANHTDATASLSGGNQQTTFLLSGTFHNESTVQSSDNQFNRYNIHVNLDHQSLDKKFKIQFNTFYLASNNYQKDGSLNMLSVVTSVPNYPVYNPDGTYNWANTNYVAQSMAYNKSQTQNLNSNLNLSYELMPGLKLKGSLGYNRIENGQIVVYPSTYNNPAFGIQGRSIFTNNYIQTLLFEPQISYDKQISKGKLSILGGATTQQNHTQGTDFDVSGYSSDLLLENPGYGSSIYATGTNVDYKYLSVFGRVTYNWEDKYIINGTFRRDGSSRFGPDKKFGDFGSIGSAWIFSEENLIKDNLKFLSFGKLRGSWGTTGNDGIGDYQYLSTYTSTQNYGSQPSIIPSRIANNNYSWEVNKKLEFALDLGFLNNNILFNTAWYRNRSGNQLVGYPLPSTTGFSSYIANLPALVQNKGWEFELSTSTGKGTFQWKTSSNLTIPNNKLLQFDNLQSSTYANSLVVGQPLNIVQGYHFLKVDPQTGSAVVQDINKDGNIEAVSSYNNQGGDYIIMGKTSPDWYGGMNNTFIYKNFQLDIFIQYVRQKGYNIYSYNYSNFGWLSNGWTDYLGYWKKPGDVVSLPKPTYNYDPSAQNFQMSDAGFTDASFLRFKNISFSYNFPSEMLKHLKIHSLRLYVQAQNMITITRYKGYDPELAGNPALNVPTLRTFNVGLQTSL